MNPRKVVIDFNALVGRDSVTQKKYVMIKELTIVDVDTKCASHTIFEKPKDNPFNYSGEFFGDRTNNWLASHYHGLDYHTGFTSYESLLQVLNYHCDGARFIFAPDVEKAKVLEKLFKRKRIVFSLQMLGAPTLPAAAHFPEISDEEDENGEDMAGCCGSAPVCLHEKTEVDSQEVSLVKGWPKCLYHHRFATDFVCSQSNALLLAEWCLENTELLDMTESSVRQKTYGEWKLSTPSAKDLAEAGFVRCCSTKDTTKCIYCGVALYQWEEDDDPFVDHDYNSPYCKYVRFLRQLERDEAQLHASKGGRSTHKACQYDQDDFRKRYGTAPDISERDLIKLCSA